ncbi:MAG: magnetochrome domain-containing protein [Magnetococcales bacterium]|nr:magnetochrome domain-containing protein [Magnetococcales bacterium]
MKQTQWFMAVGIVFSLALFFLAVFAEDPWEDHVYNKAPPIAAGMSAFHRDGRERMTCSSCHEMIASNPNSGTPYTPALVEGTPAIPSHRDGRDQMACSDCHQILPRMHPPRNEARAPLGAAAMAQSVPAALTVAMPAGTMPPRTPAAAAFDPEWHERFMPTRFQGKILRVVEDSIQSGRLNTHILVYDGINEPTWINLAPNRYLEQQGCRIGIGLFVKGTAYQERGTIQNALRYAKSFSINGQFCRLRDRHLRCAWSGAGLKEQDEE